MPQMRRTPLSAEGLGEGSNQSSNHSMVYELQPVFKNRDGDCR
jgi:hypothetical protein